jgi:chromosomal replication initiation ATPase DnaA
MSTVAEDLRAEAIELRKRAATLEALAARLDGESSAPVDFEGDERIGAILRAICAELDVPVAFVLAEDRRAHVVVARDCCAHALRHLLGFALQRISNALGRLDHSTTAFALRRVRNRRDTEKRFAADLERAMKAAHAALAKIEGIAA